MEDDEVVDRKKLKLDTEISMLKSGRWKTPKKIPVVVVEDHCEVLPCIYRLIGSKRLPLNSMSLIHLDSHSDLSVPPISADSVFSKEELFGSVSIQSWILPMVYAGHINVVAWLTPFWTSHSFAAESNFLVGKDRETQQIRVTSSENYFLSELAYSSESELTDCKPLSLHVMTLGDKSVCAHSATADTCGRKISSMARESNVVDVHCVNVKPTCCDRVSPRSCDCCTVKDKSNEIPPSNQHCLVSDSVGNTEATSDFTDVENAVQRLSQMLVQHCKSDCFILDIDLDFFSTMNPFLSSFTEQQYQLLSELYAYRSPLDRSVENVERCKEERRAQLSYLQSIMTSAQSGQVPQVTDSRRDQLLRQLFISIKQPLNQDDLVLDDTFDYDWLHEIGSGVDDCPLPHHISSDAEIINFLERVKRLLSMLPRPAAVTVARSSSDGYCPSDQVDFIQTSLVHMLETVYGDIDVKLNYASEAEQQS